MTPTAGRAVTAPSGDALAGYCARSPGDGGEWDLWAAAAAEWVTAHADVTAWGPLHTAACLELGRWYASLRGQAITGNVVIGDFGAAYIGQHVPAVGKLLTVHGLPGLA